MKKYIILFTLFLFLSNSDTIAQSCGPALTGSGGTTATSYCSGSCPSGKFCSGPPSCNCDNECDATINRTCNDGDANTTNDVEKISVYTGTVCSPCAGTVLPVELVKFEAKLNRNKSILLEWETATELNNKGFYIQRNGINSDWENIGFVEGNGTSIQQHNYSFADTKPLEGTNYYSLKQIDFDGQFEYSDIVSVEFEGNLETDFIIYPNPSVTDITIDYTNLTEINTIKLYNSQGQFLKEIPIQTTGKTQIELTDLANGIYWIRINDSYTKRFIKL